MSTDLLLKILIVSPIIAERVGAFVAELLDKSETSAEQLLDEAGKVNGETIAILEAAIKGK